MTMVRFDIRYDKLHCLQMSHFIFFHDFEWWWSSVVKGSGGRIERQNTKFIQIESLPNSEIIFRLIIYWMRCESLTHDSMEPLVIYHEAVGGIPPWMGTSSLLTSSASWIILLKLWFISLRHKNIPRTRKASSHEKGSERPNVKNNIIWIQWRHFS